MTTCLGCLKAEEGTGMVVHDELQSTGLQQVACMVQLTHLRYCPYLVGTTLLQHQSGQLSPYYRYNRNAAKRPFIMHIIVQYVMLKHITT